MFETLQQFKDRCEFFKAGSIVPQRVLKGPRKVKHRVKFLHNTWRFNAGNKYVVFIQNTIPLMYYIRISNVDNSDFTIAPYRKNFPVLTVFTMDAEGVCTPEEVTVNTINKLISLS